MMSAQVRRYDGMLYRSPARRAPKPLTVRVRRIRLALVSGWLFLACMPSVALGDAGKCAELRDSNARYFCMAERTGRREPCASISGDDSLRRLCIARATGSSSECASIPFGDRRKFCEATAGR